jgi:hypothetical protein
MYKPKWGTTSVCALNIFIQIETDVAGRLLGDNLRDNENIRVWVNRAFTVL